MIHTRIKNAPRLLLLCLAGVIAVTSFAPAAGATSKQQIKRGGVVTDLIDAGTWNGLDPATSLNTAQRTELFSAVFGQLFELGPKGTIIPGEATSYKFSNHGLTVDIYLRHNIKFSDGTAFNAQAVASAINSDLAPGSICACVANFALLSSVGAVGLYDVRIQLKALDAPIISSFIDEAPNFTPSPTALAAEGPTQFAINPVGAGPFTVTSDEAAVKLTTVRNPHYFIKGEPYLAGVNFVVTASDASDLDAIETGEAQMTLVTATTTFQQAQGIPGIKTYKFPATSPEFVRINTLVAPFNNPIAREAVSYATDTKTLVEQLYGNLYSQIQGFGSPGELFYTKTIPNYRGYNLAKAQALVASIPGGLTVQLQTTNNLQTSITETGAIAEMWKAAGINVTVAVETGQYTITERENHVGWQAMDGGYSCSIDPASCTGTNLASNGLFSAVRDPRIDGMLNQAAQYINPTTRTRVYVTLNSYLNTQADMVWLYGKNILMVTSNKLQGINPKVAVPVGYDDWEGIWLK